MSLKRPLILVTNDDGIQSGFLKALVEELKKVGEVLVCAPDGERSWIGHAISRNQKLKPKEEKKYPAIAYSLNGTPADCVNLAYGNLMSDEPDLVVSGINLGYNITLPMILSSGTVGAALEGSLLGIPSIAVSMAITSEKFDSVRESGGQNLDSTTRNALKFSAKAAAKYAKLVLEMHHHEGLTVHNLNFPEKYDGKTDPLIGFADNLKLGSLFQKEKGKQHHQLVYRTEWLEEAEAKVGSDLWAHKEGLPSVTRLDFSQMNGKSYLMP
ncbi:MAG: 5'/3'-nucleotidase SurE [Verrucomicrobiota bacterium]|nr:5'/3'-nucleotidase SurE [Verrucomicrobiota bacterium]